MCKAVSLFSGGLDSVLSIKIAEKAGIVVIPVFFKHSFIKELDERVKNEVRQTIIKINLEREFLDIFLSPKYGFGKNLNPCIDCKILFFQKAKQIMFDKGADFIISGEVIGQRPFSQKKRAMKIIEKKAGVEELVLRPLSQKLLEPIIPEKKGLIDRKNFLSISGRARKEQLKLAKEFNLNFVPTPAGGCLLTDEIFSEKIKLLMKRNILTLDNIELLKFGRFITPDEKNIIIIGRNEKENINLKNLFKRCKEKIFIETITPPGPSAVVTRNLGRDKYLNIIMNYIKSDKAKFKIINEKNKENIVNFSLK